jgi:uncharacterized RDD family membrane protein YckC
MNESQRWAGDRLGFPEAGPGSLAKMGRRVAALSIDWAAALLISYAFFGADNTATLLIFAIQSFVLTGLTGSSFGHRIMGLRLKRLDGLTMIGLPKAAIRIALILLVLPAVIWDNDNRGLHDKLAGTALVRR